MSTVTVRKIDAGRHVCEKQASEKWMQDRGQQIREKVMMREGEETKGCGGKKVRRSGGEELRRQMG